tara:strand:+ start:1366 stop:2838 length:1473 start_codon:yes stop_codon:yes gene_type:complete
MDENNQASPVQEEQVSAPPEQHRVEMEQSPIKSLIEDEVVASDIQQKFLSFLNVDMKELDNLSENYSKTNTASDERGRVWTVAWREALANLLKGNALSDSVEREDSAWRQKVDSNGEKLAAGRPRFGNNGSNVISGERALMKATNALGLGAVVQIPLWHTGIWVSIKPPSEASLLELERRIGNEKISLGRYTSGMIFSNTSVYTVSYVVNFVLNHVYDASVKNITQENLKQLIKVTDIPTLVWGMACAIYPNGYKYARPCTTNPAECQHVVKAELNLTKLFWTDNNALTDWQRRMMSRRTDKYSEEDLERYEKEHFRGGATTFELQDNFKVRLQVPTIAQYEASGFAWVDGIVRLLEGSLGVSLKGKERDDYIVDQGRLTALQQYSHWVKEIMVDDDSIVDQETIESLLGSLSSQEDISKQFFEKVGQFIDGATIALVALPKYDCPACGGEQEADVHGDRHPHLLPIDAVRVFFTLLDQRIYKALTSRRL